MLPFPLFFSVGGFMYDLFIGIMNIFIQLLGNSLFQTGFFLIISVFFFLWCCCMIKRGFEP